MFFTDRGSGQPVLLIHGFPLDHTMWRHQIEEFAGNFRLVAPDLPGFGASPLGDGAYSVDRYADEVADLLDGPGIAQVVVVGLSMGGYVAFAFWRRHPERVRALVFADTKAQADTPEGRQARAALAQEVRARGSEAAIERMLPTLLAKETHEKRADVVEEVKGMMRAASVPGIVAALSAMAERPDSLPTLATISVPSLVVVGENDKLSPPSDASIIHGGIKGSQLALIPQAGHLSPLENPQGFNAALRAFLEPREKRGGGYDS